MFVGLSVWIGQITNLVDKQAGGGIMKLTEGIPLPPTLSVQIPGSPATAAVVFRNLSKPREPAQLCCHSKSGAAAGFYCHCSSEQLLDTTTTK